ncbi:hypothetical protein FRC02_010680 [Tulasnella sp. 418]|nr:hypothetical protein FRC02_010680 [Tulasnella sp. 418]
MEVTSSAKSKCADLYEGIKQAEARREELRSQLPFFTPRGLFSSSVQSISGLIDHGGHCYQVEGLLARSQFLEAELDRHARMLQVRVQLATLEYYYENMKLAREAKHDAERRAEQLRERMYRLNQENSRGNSVTYCSGGGIGQAQDGAGGCDESIGKGEETARRGH